MLRFINMQLSTLSHYNLVCICDVDKQTEIYRVLASETFCKVDYGFYQTGIVHICKIWIPNFQILYWANAYNSASWVHEELFIRVYLAANSGVQRKTFVVKSAIDLDKMKNYFLKEMLKTDDILKKKTN